jgi:hypothetical protein
MGIVFKVLSVATPRQRAVAFCYESVSALFELRSKILPISVPLV